MTRTVVATQRTSPTSVNREVSQKSNSAGWVPARTEVVAVVINLGVVGLEESGVDAKVARDEVAVVSLLDDVGGLAVLTSVAEAERLANLKVCAAIVNGLVV